MNKSFAVLALALLSFAAQAQSVDTTATSGSQSGASTQTQVNNALTLETNPLRDTTIRTAPGHGMASTTSSVSSDYCGATAQIGGSSMGWSFGVSKNVADKNCQKMRLIDKFGLLAEQAAKFNDVARRNAAQSMAFLIACTALPEYQDDCKALGLVVDKD